MVDDLGRGGDEVERQEDAGGQEDYEGVEGDLPQEERPVVGEDLVEHDAAALGHAEAVVEPAYGPFDRLVLGRRLAVGRGAVLGGAVGRGGGGGGGHVVFRSQKPGPMGWS